MHRYLLPLSLCLLALCATSFTWPLKDGRVTATFGESRWDHFHEGIDMAAADENVYPVKTGSLVYYWDRSLFPLENYPGGGNFKILDHGNRTYSVYMHLADGVRSEAPSTPSKAIAMMGNTGHSLSKHLHFSILDLAKNQALNPQKLLPVREDRLAPEITDIAMHIGDKYVIIRNNAQVRLTRHWPLLIRINDAMTGRERTGVYRLAVSINGKKIIENVYDAISFVKNTASIGGRSHDALYDEKGYYKVDNARYVDGDNTITVTAVDFAGNTTGKSFTFSVRLDIKDE